jgi:hypothetical protein
MVSNANLSMTVNGIVRETSVHDFQRTNMKLMYKKASSRDPTSAENGNLKGKGRVDLNPSSQMNGS